MPFGFDDACGLLQVVGFSASAFQACVKGLILLSKARSFSRDVSGVRLMIEIEQHKLYTWAEEVGLLQLPATLLVAAQHAELVPKILGHLQELVTDLQKLKHNYGLDLQETDEEILDLEHEETAFQRLSIRSREHSAKSVSKIFNHRQKAWRVLKWVTFDEVRIGKLVDQIRLFTQELQQILDRTRQMRMDHGLNVLLRNAVLNTSNEQDLDMMSLDYVQVAKQSDIAAAARFKKQGLLLGILNVQDTASVLRKRSQDTTSTSRTRRASSYTLIPRYTNSDLTAMRLSARLLNISMSALQDTRAVAHYAGQPVLLEFRHHVDLDPMLAKDRMYKVSAFLKNLDASFHGLSCRGYVKINGRYAYIFDLPTQESIPSDMQTGIPGRAPTPHVPTFRTLRDLLDTRTPSLNLRLAFAITILETLLQLHTSGWLHKEFRSENVLFIQAQGQENLTDDDYLRIPPIVAGYVYARADLPFEATEPMLSELEADLYRHPASMCTPRFKYRKSFDMFGVGCILLELGLWASLPALLAQCSDTAQCHFEAPTAVDLLKVRHDLLLIPAPRLQSLQRPTHEPSHISKPADTAVFDSLNAAIGAEYTTVVLRLLTAFNETAERQTVGVGIDIDERLLNTEIDCLDRLRGIASSV